MGFRDNLPPSVAEIVQNGLLDGIFQDALVPTFLYDSLADLKPWASALGSQSIFTRAGLITPFATAITGADATADTYPFEQYSVKTTPQPPSAFMPRKCACAPGRSEPGPAQCAVCQKRLRVRFGPI